MCGGAPTSSLSCAALQRSASARSTPAHLFAAVAAWAFRRDLRLVIAGLVAHAVMDFFHGGIVSNPGVPSWWPAWCAAYDLAAPVYLAVLVRRGRVALHPVAR